MCTVIADEKQQNRRRSRVRCALTREKARKCHIIEDTLGLPIACRVETANISDRTCALTVSRWIGRPALQAGIPGFVRSSELRSVNLDGEMQRIRSQS